MYQSILRMCGSFIRTTLFVLVAAAGLLAQISTAAADHPHQIEVHFDELTLEAHDRLVTVDYTIDSSDWTHVERLGVVPLFDLAIPTDDGESVYLARDVEMTESSDRLVVAGHPFLVYGTAVHFEPVSAYHTHRAGDVDLTGDFAHTFEFSLHDGPATWRGDDIESGRESAERCSYCDEETSRRDRQHGGSEQGRGCDERCCGGRCDRGDESEPNQQADVIEACDEATTFSSSRETCRQTASDIGFGDAVQTVEACGEQTSHSSNFEQCIESAVDFRAAPSQTVTACGEATAHSSHFIDCLDAASDANRDASPVVEACGDSTTFSSDFVECVEDGVE